MAAAVCVGADAGVVEAPVEGVAGVVDGVGVDVWFGTCEMTVAHTPTSNTTISKKTPYRGAGGRDHGDIPTPELAGLAEVLRAEGLDETEIVRGMQAHFGLGRLAASTRERFETAVKLSVTMRQV